MSSARVEFGIGDLSMLFCNLIIILLCESRNLSSWTLLCWILRSAIALKCAVDTWNMWRCGISSNALTMGATSENGLQAGASGSNWAWLDVSVLGILLLDAGTLGMSCEITLTLAGGEIACNCWKSVIILQEGRSSGISPSVSDDLKRWSLRIVELEHCEDTSDIAREREHLLHCVKAEFADENEIGDVDVDLLNTGLWKQFSNSESEDNSTSGVGCEKTALTGNRLSGSAPPARFPEQLQKLTCCLHYSLAVVDNTGRNFLQALASIVAEISGRSYYSCHNYFLDVVDSNIADCLANSADSGDLFPPSFLHTIAMA